MKTHILKRMWGNTVGKALLTGWLMCSVFLAVIVLNIHDRETQKITSDLEMLSYNLLGYIAYDQEKEGGFFVKKDNEKEYNQFIQTHVYNTDSDIFSYLWDIKNQQVAYTPLGNEKIPPHHKTLIEKWSEKYSNTPQKPFYIGKVDDEFHGSYMTASQVFSFHEKEGKKTKYLFIVGSSTEHRDQHIADLTDIGYLLLLIFLVIALAAMFFFRKKNLPETQLSGT